MSQKRLHLWLMATLTVLMIPGDGIGFGGRVSHTYDIDIFMRGQSTGLVPSDVLVHKEDGHARFNWVKNNGAWEQRPVGAH